MRRRRRRRRRLAGACLLLPMALEALDPINEPLGLPCPPRGAQDTPTAHSLPRDTLQCSETGARNEDGIQNEVPPASLTSPALGSRYLLAWPVLLCSAVALWALGTHCESSSVLLCHRAQPWESTAYF